MLVVRAHVGKNCLYVTLVGRLDEARAREAVPHALREMDRLRPGFHIMSDVAFADVLPEPVLEQVRAVMRAAQERGMGGVVRVVGRGVRVALQLEKTSRQLGYAAHLAFSHEEAERLLLRRSHAAQQSDGTLPGGLPREVPASAGAALVARPVAAARSLVG